MAGGGGGMNRLQQAVAAALVLLSLYASVAILYGRRDLWPAVSRSVCSSSGGGSDCASGGGGSLADGGRALAVMVGTSRQLVVPVAQRLDSTLFRALATLSSGGQLQHQPDNPEWVQLLGHVLPLRQVEQHQLCGLTQQQLRRSLLLPHSCQAGSSRYFLDGAWVDWTHLDLEVSRPGPASSSASSASSWLSSNGHRKLQVDNGGEEGGDAQVHEAGWGGSEDIVCVLACVDAPSPRCSQDAPCVHEFHLRRRHDGGSADTKELADVYEMDSPSWKALWGGLSSRTLGSDSTTTRRGVLDSPAGIGIAAVYLAAMLPEGLVVAVEPCSAEFDMLVRNTRTYSNIVPLHAGLWQRMPEDYGSSGRPDEGREEQVEAALLRRMFGLQSWDVVRLDLRWGGLSHFFPLPSTPSRPTPSPVFPPHLWLADSRRVVVEPPVWTSFAASRRATGGSAAMNSDGRRDLGPAGVRDPPLCSTRERWRAAGGGSSSSSTSLGRTAGTSSTSNTGGGSVGSNSWLHWLGLHSDAQNPAGAPEYVLHEMAQAGLQPSVAVPCSVATGATKRTVWMFTRQPADQSSTSAS